MISDTKISDTNPAKPDSAFVRFLAILKEMASRPSGMVGLILVAFHIIMALTSPLLVPYDFRAMDAEAVLSGPSTEHWLGTDSLGRDTLTRTMLGGQQALLVTSISTVIAISWGGLLGVLLGLVGGRLENYTMRLVDAFLSIPWILFLLLIVSVVGLGNGVLIPTLGFFYGIPVVRMARAATHDVVALDFVTAARARGESKLTIASRELLPNVLDVLLVEGAMRWSWMLLAFSSLSFLGFGVSPPTADWGLMISGSRNFMSFAPWAVLAPVVALSSLIIGINFCADALAKALGIDRAQKAPV
jgi:peptide/nickel transport system permease protein